MADFDVCIQFVLKHETYTNSKGVLITSYQDKLTGENSNYGITEDLLKAIKYSIKDPQNLQLTDIYGIYARQFWSPYSLGSISSNLVAQKILDMLVNMGPNWGGKSTQAALNSKGFPCVIDGIIGPHTKLTIERCVQSIGEVDFLQELALKSATYYKSLKIVNADKNLKTWLARADDIGLDHNYEAKA